MTSEQKIDVYNKLKNKYRKSLKAVVKSAHDLLVYSDWLERYEQNYLKEIKSKANDELYRWENRGISFDMMFDDKTYIRKA